MEHISLTVPHERNALTRAIDFLRGFVVDLDKADPDTIVQAAAAALKDEPAPGAPAAEPATTATTAPASPASVFNSPTPGALGDVDVGKTNGLPWDERIHSGKKAKLAKTGDFFFNDLFSSLRSYIP